MNTNSKVALPGRNIDELVGLLTRHEHQPHRCTGHTNCPDAAHGRRPPGKVVYFADHRPGSPWRSRHEGAIRVTYRCLSVHPDLLAAWRQKVGDPYDPVTYGLDTLETIVRNDGGVLLLGRAVNSIFDLWITIEKAAP